MSLVLIVDDHPDVARMVAGFVAVAGGESVIAGDARQCFEALEQKPVDLIVLDDHMPGVRGLDVLTVLRQSERFHALPIVLFSGHEDIRAEAIERGATAFVGKTHAADELLPLLQDACARAAETST